MYCIHLKCPCGYEWLEPADNSPYMKEEEGCPNCGKTEAEDSYTYDFYYQALPIRRGTK